MAYINYKSNSQGIVVDVNVGGHHYKRDLTKLSPNERAKIVNGLREWNKEGAVGFPPMGK